LLGKYFIDKTRTAENLDRGGVLLKESPDTMNDLTWDMFSVAGTINFSPVLSCSLHPCTNNRRIGRVGDMSIGPSDMVAKFF
jgi:hypothetical protein